MTKYVALLRRINIGGGNKILMADFKAALIKKDYCNYLPIPNLEIWYFRLILMCKMLFVRLLVKFF
jgi:hypothetical protein